MGTNLKEILDKQPPGIRNNADDGKIIMKRLLNNIHDESGVPKKDVVLFLKKEGYKIKLGDCNDIS